MSSGKCHWEGDFGSTVAFSTGTRRLVHPSHRASHGPGAPAVAPSAANPFGKLFSPGTFGTFEFVEVWPAIPPGIGLESSKPGASRERRLSALDREGLEGILFPASHFFHLSPTQNTRVCGSCDLPARDRGWKSWMIPWEPVLGLRPRLNPSAGPFPLLFPWENPPLFSPGPGFGEEGAAGRWGGGGW